jgi:multiple sugar transport system ATP-binding protein
MDEPLSNLDAKLRGQMRAEVARIQRRLAVATLYVTHDQVEAMTMGDKVAVLSAGVLQQCDSPRALYDRPRNLFVAGFMGSPPMNLFEANVGEGARSLRFGSQTIELPETVRTATPDLGRYTGRSVVLGVRPEDLDAFHGDGGLSLSGSVELVEALGSEQLVHFTTDAEAVEVKGTKDDDADGLSHGAIRRAGEGVARIDARATVREGEQVHFGIEADRLRFFDPETTEALGRPGGASNRSAGAESAVRVGGDGSPVASAGDTGPSDSARP